MGSEREVWRSARDPVGLPTGPSEMFEGGATDDAAGPDDEDTPCALAGIPRRGFVLGQPVVKVLRVVVIDDYFIKEILLKDCDCGS